MPTVIVHMMNEDPVLGEMDALPNPTDNLILVKNPRAKDGKDLRNLEANVTVAVWPVHRITMIEVMPSGEDEEIITFVRE